MRMAHKNRSVCQEGSWYSASWLYMPGLPYGTMRGTVGHNAGDEI